jgi:Double-GTPase 2
VSKRIVCLTCLSTFGLDGIRWADSRGVPVAAPPQVENSPLRRRLKQIQNQGPEPAMAQFADFEAQGYEPQCPLGHTLPIEVAQRDTIVIGLIGEIASGKTHYLASLVMGLLEGDLLAQVGIDVGLAPESRTYFGANYQAPLYGAQQVLPATALIADEEDIADRRPIILVMRDVGTRRETNVIFYDASGEQLSSSASVAKYNRFLYAADALFFLVPPVALPGVRAQIETPDAYRQSLVQTKGMIDGLELQLRKAQGLGQGTLDVAAAVLLTKADLCRGVQGFDDDLLLEPDYSAESVDDTMARIARETGQVSRFITGARGAQLVMGVESRFPGATFHAVSATGCNREGDTYPHLSPSRCADPFISTLVRCGVLSTGRSSVAGYPVQS